MLHVQAEKEKIEKIAITYEKLQSDLYADLEKEFEKDLNQWNAVLDRQTLSVRFKEPEGVICTRGSGGTPRLQKHIEELFFPVILKF